MNVLINQNEKLRFMLRAVRNCLFKAITSPDYISERYMCFLFECWIQGSSLKMKWPIRKLFSVIEIRDGRALTYNSGSVDGRNVTNSINIYQIESIDICDLLSAGGWDKRKSRIT